MGTIDLSNLDLESIPSLTGYYSKDEYFFGNELSDEEKIEKKELERLFEEAKKEEMKALFINSNSSLRERIVDGIMYERLKIKLAFIKYDQSGVPERLKELRRTSIKLNTGQFMNGTDKVLIRDTINNELHDLHILRYFTEDEVIEMHKNAVMMEMINE